MTKRLLWRGALFALGVGMAVFAGSSPNSTALAGASVAQSAGQIAPPQPGLARVWIIRQFEPGETLRAPLVYINGAPITLAEPGTAFYRDLPPGAYRFTVDSCTRDTGQATNLNLTPGMDVPLEVQSLESFISPDCRPPTNFYVRQISPQWAQMYFNQVAYLGSR